MTKQTNDQTNKQPTNQPTNQTIKQTKKQNIKNKHVTQVMKHCEVKQTNKQQDCKTV